MYFMGKQTKLLAETVSWQNIKEKHKQIGKFVLLDFMFAR